MILDEYSCRDETYAVAGVGKVEKFARSCPVETLKGAQTSMFSDILVHGGKGFIPLLVFYFSVGLVCFRAFFEAVVPN